MSHIDSFQHEIVGLFARLPVYHPFLISKIDKYLGKINYIAIAHYLINYRCFSAILRTKAIAIYKLLK